MVKFYWLTVLFFCLGGCGTFGTHEELWVRPDFLPYYKQFLLDANSHGKTLIVSDLTIDFGTLKSPKIGECTTIKGVAHHVIIDRTHWIYGLTEGKRKELIYHELGHCLLSLGHTEGMVRYQGEDIPKSIMSAVILDDYLFTTYETYYINELFSEQPAFKPTKGVSK